jgi:murein DD-endopeptidase MepM/ murein hydrolase activator NlpD
MDKHFTITIEDEKGKREFNLHKILKKVLIYTALFLFSVLFVSLGSIVYLNGTLVHIEKKKARLEASYVDLAEKIMQKEEELKNNKAKLCKVTDSLSEVERIIGLKPLDKSLQQRVDSAKLTAMQRATLLRFLPSGSPVLYNGITSKFGYRIHPTLHKREFHKGIDLKARKNTPVYATADAIVEWAGYHKSSGFGNLVILTHMYGFKTYFGHLQRVVVKSGQFVKKGELIAYSGNTGLSNGPHLHYEIRFLQRPLNPYYFIKWTQQNYNEIFEKEHKVPWKSILMAMKQLEIVQPRELKLTEQKSIITQENNVTGKTL